MLMNNLTWQCPQINKINEKSVKGPGLTPPKNYQKLLTISFGLLLSLIKLLFILFRY